MFAAALILIPFHLFYYWYFLPVWYQKGPYVNAWFWIFQIIIVSIACLNWCILLLALRKDNIDHLGIFSLNFNFVIWTVIILCGALWLANLIIGFAYTVLIWVLVDSFDYYPAVSKMGYSKFLYTLVFTCAGFTQRCKLIIKPIITGFTELIENSTSSYLIHATLLYRF